MREFELQDYLDMMKEDLLIIDNILINTGSGVNVSPQDLDKIFAILEDIESEATKAQKLI